MMKQRNQTRQQRSKENQSCVKITISLNLWGLAVHIIFNYIYNENIHLMPYAKMTRNASSVI